MGKLNHLKDTQPFSPWGRFPGLTFAQQARSITAMTNILKKASNANVRKAVAEGRDAVETREMCIDQIKRMKDSL